MISHTLASNQNFHHGSQVSRAAANPVDFEDILLQAAMHAASSGLMIQPRFLHDLRVFNAADAQSLQRVQNQFNRVDSVTKRYWVT